MIGSGTGPVRVLQKVSYPARPGPARPTGPEGFGLSGRHGPMQCSGIDQLLVHLYAAVPSGRNFSVDKPEAVPKQRRSAVQRNPVNPVCLANFCCTVLRYCFKTNTHKPKCTTVFDFFYLWRLNQWASLVWMGNFDCMNDVGSCWEGTVRLPAARLPQLVERRSCSPKITGPNRAPLTVFFTGFQCTVKRERLVSSLIIVLLPLISPVNLSCTVLRYCFKSNTTAGAEVRSFHSWNDLHDATYL